MNLERSFTFAFKARNATKKLIIGGVFSMLFFTVFFAFVVIGYLMRILCSALEGRDGNLPEWNNLPGLFNESLQPAMLTLIYASPFVVLQMVEQFVVASIGLNITVFALFTLLKLVFLGVLSLFLPLALIRLVVKGSLGAGLDFQRIIFFIRNNPRNFFVAWGLSVALQFGAAIVGMILFGIGIFFTTFIAYVISVHLYAQAYRASTPFNDDQEGAMRASMAVPPPLHGQ